MTEEEIEIKVIKPEDLSSEDDDTENIPVQVMYMNLQSPRNDSTDCSNDESQIVYPNTFGNGNMDVTVSSSVVGYLPASQMSRPAAVASADLLDIKGFIEEWCPVCGDRVSGYHYGLLTCESCKGFFKRSVQNKKVYTCFAERNCHIDKTQRKRCPYCRFQKCLEVGMKLEAVRANRVRGGRNKFGPMYKRDRARKLQMMQHRQIGILGMDGSISFSYLSDLSSPLSGLDIKQEIQIPQVSSLTSSTNSSSSLIAVALGQTAATPGGTQPTTLLPSENGSLPAGTPCDGGGIAVSEHKEWTAANSSMPSPHSPKLFQYEGNASALICDFIAGLDDREWKDALFTLLQNQTYNQCEVDLFELLCKVLDQNLFSQVDWARNSVFFKDVKVDDQMKLLQHSWSDMLVLDHIHQRMHNNLPDETTLYNGQKFDLLSLCLLGVRTLQDRFFQVTRELHDLKFDINDYICLKFLLLLNPDVRGLTDKRHIQEGRDQVRHSLIEYCATDTQIQDRFDRLMSLMPQIHDIATRGEDFLYHEHCIGNAPTQTLLMEMLHAKRKYADM